MADDPADISCECRVGKLQVGLIEVHVDALELQVRVAVVRARRVDAVLVRDHLREWTRILISGELFRVRNIALFMQQLPDSATRVRLLASSFFVGPQHWNPWELTCPHFPYHNMRESEILLSNSGSIVIKY